MLEVDPISIPAWLIAIYGFAMYPIGFMLGSSCSPCCEGTPCGCEEGASLPEYVDVAFSGLVSSETKSSNLLSLSITSCFGTGAAGTVVGGDRIPGPIASVTLTASGTGYAEYGRKEPTLLIQGKGTGLTFKPDFNEVVDACGLSTFSVKSVAVSGDPVGYGDGEFLDVAASPGDITLSSSVMRLYLDRGPPTLTAEALGGEGAELKVNVSNVIGKVPAEWSISEIEIVSGGSGYTDGDEIFISLGEGDYEIVPAYPRVVTEVVPPDVEIVVSSPTGIGAEFGKPTFEKIPFKDGRFRLSGNNLDYAITSGGAGYELGDTVALTVINGATVAAADAVVDFIDENTGEITGILINNPGEYYWDKGSIVGVEFLPTLYGTPAVTVYGGRYYKDAAASVSVQAPGSYYTQDKSLPAVVSDIDVEIIQKAKFVGSGAEIKAYVDSDPLSGTFGQITDLKIEQGGKGYLSYEYTQSPCCTKQVNNTFLAKLSSDCVYQMCDCKVGSSDERGTYGESALMDLSVVYRGQLTPPYVTVGTLCPSVFTASEDDAPFRCDGFSFSATNDSGLAGSVKVSPSLQTCETEVFAGYGCCVGEVSGGYLASCDEESCVANRGTWHSGCRCFGCSEENCENVSLAVGAELKIVSEFAKANGYQDVSVSVELNKDNGWSWSDGNDIANIVRGLCGLYVLLQSPHPSGNNMVGGIETGFLSTGTDGCPRAGGTFKSCGGYVFGGLRLCETAEVNVTVAVIVDE